MKISDVDLKKVSPMMMQYIEIKQKNPDTIIFFRLGDFYEMFFEDAVNISKVLELTLTGKNAGLDERIPMCGIPHHAVNIYAQKLVDMGYKIGICEQLEDAKSTKTLVKRDIVRIITKGTLLADNNLVASENNYIGSLLLFENVYTLIYADISTGEVNGLLISKHKSDLVSTILSLGIKELIVSGKFDKTILDTLKRSFNILITVTDEIKEISSPIYEDINDERIIKCTKYLLTYLTYTQKSDLSYLQKINLKNVTATLKMDIHTKRNLELTETMRLKEKEFSLFWLLDKTKTAMGARLLRNYIENPLTDEKEIIKRQDYVQKLITEFIIKGDLVNYLNEVYDIERLISKIVFGSANARDLLQLKNSLKVLPNIKNLLEKLAFDKKIYALEELYNLLEKAIYEDPPVGLKEGYLIKEGFYEELDYLKSLRKGGKDFIAQFELEERERTGIKNLKVGFNRVFGYYIEVTNVNASLVKEEFGYIRKQTLVDRERYISPILKEKEDLILNAEEKIINLEYDLFCSVRDKIKEYTKELQENAKIIAQIDVLASFASVAEDYNYIRPTINKQNIVDIKDSRHPTLERVVNAYVNNDFLMDEKTNILLVTGPNMGGKSTYMRQLALIFIMAQIGCFVPASEANLPIIDAIYTRIGASDDLVSGQSTFMVEMNEANNAIKKATKNSLILFDELGRGTATFDGMALAQSLLEYIHNEIGCKTIFSTHYHELVDLENSLKYLKNVHVAAHEEDKNIVFLHKVKEGSIDKSYGINVAKLAGLPDYVIKRAVDILEVYENKEKKRDTYIQQSLPLNFESEKTFLEKELEGLDVLELTPMQALNILYEWKDKL